MTYRDIIDGELPVLMDGFDHFRPKVRREISHVCLRAFVNGIYVRANAAPDTVAVIRYVLDADLDQQEKTILGSMTDDFFNLGSRIDLQDKSQLLPHASEAVEYVADRLHCRDYCGEAMKRLLETGQRIHSTSFGLYYRQLMPTTQKQN